MVDIGTVKEGCLVCGGALVYTESAMRHRCAYCGKEGDANACCEKGHYVCDECHMEKGLNLIKAYAMKAEGRDPVAMAAELMESPEIFTHGPEHHFLVPAVLIAAYKNCGGAVDITRALETALERSRTVPGGICGLWGCCGAAVGAGIYMSVVLSASPLSGRSWALSNGITARCLEEISSYGGPRCCKRDSFLALTAAARFTEERLGIAFTIPGLEKTVCAHWGRNPQCIKRACPFYPGNPS